jgi:hypothetical protein
MAHILIIVSLTITKDRHQIHTLNINKGNERTLEERQINTGQQNLKLITSQLSVI